VLSHTLGDVTNDAKYPEAEVDGFTIGMFVSYGEVGDAWVRTPDGGIAGLIW
jgi:hypothetical protein